MATTTTMAVAASGAAAEAAAAPGADNSNTATNVTLIVVGEKGVGKTSLVDRYVYNIFMGTYPISSSSEESDDSSGGQRPKESKREIELDGRPVKLILVDGSDIDGITEETFARNLSTDGLSGFIAVYDVNDTDSYISVIGWLNMINNVSPEKRKECLVIGNKSDLPSSEREVEYHDAKNYLNTFEIGDFMETSAKKNSNVKYAIENIVRRLLQKDDQMQRQGRRNHQGGQQAYDNLCDCNCVCS